MVRLTIPQFRRMYQNMIDKKKTQFLVNLNSSEDWIIVTRRSFPSNVHVGHKISLSAVDLALFAPSRNIVGTKIPPGCIDVSTTKTRQFRWYVNPIDASIPPFDQLGVKQAIERAHMAFDWVSENRVHA